MTTPDTSNLDNSGPTSAELHPRIHQRGFVPGASSTAVDLADIYAQIEQLNIQIAEGGGGGGGGGVPGPPGPPGPEGPPGPQGEFINLLGDLELIADLPSEAEHGDAYIVNEDGNLWVYSDTRGWFNAGRIQGPQGPMGPPGPMGETGPRGPQGPAGATPGVNVRMQSFTSNGSFEKRAGSVALWVRVVGGGGGGGAAAPGPGWSAGSGGGGGGYAERVYGSNTVAASVTVTIGAGGLNGSIAGNRDGQPGGNTIFGTTAQVPTQLIGEGGNGGSNGVSNSNAGNVGGQIGGLGGNGSGGQFNARADRGGPSLIIGGSNSAPGITGGVISSGAGSRGAGSIGGGGGGPVLTAGNTGNNGTAHGGGGSGGASSTGSAAGGSGAPGCCVVVEWFTT